MRTGDLVAVRFDDCVVLGLITSRQGGGHTFIYAHGGLYGEGPNIPIATNTLPRTRFIKVRLQHKAMFRNLCDLDWSSIVGETYADRVKLAKWLASLHKK